MSCGLKGKPTGLKAAGDRGNVGGRPRKLTDAILNAPDH